MPSSVICTTAKVRGDENLSKENKMDNRSFEGFHAHLDYKLT